MYIEDVTDLEDFLAYVLTNGYNFPYPEDARLGMYWMWKAGSASIHQIRKTTKFLERRYGFRGYEVVFKTDTKVYHTAEQRSGNPHLVLIRYAPNNKLLGEMIREHNRS
jgi:hypothetical protein